MNYFINFENFKYIGLFLKYSEVKID